jgi:hypothetical protein
MAAATTIKRESEPGMVEVFRSAEEHFGQQITLIVAKEPPATLRAQLAPQYSGVLLKDRYRTVEKASDEWAGIGIVIL